MRYIDLFNLSLKFGGLLALLVGFKYEIEMLVLIGGFFYVYGNIFQEEEKK